MKDPSPAAEDVPGLHARIQRLETLARVSRQLNSTIEPRETLRRLLAEAMQLLPAQSGTVCLVNPTTGFLEIEAAVGLTGGASLLRLRIGEGLTGSVARTGRPVRIGDVSRDRRYFELRPGVRSELAVPLLADGEVRGVINLDADQLDAFSEADEALLIDLADLAVPAIANTWLYESARQRAVLLESLVKVGQIINSATSLDDALTAVVREAAALMRAQMCSLMLMDASGEWLDLRAQHGAGDAYLGKPRLSVAESLLGIVVRRRKPLQIENVQVSGRYQNVTVARQEGLVSLLSVPLLFQGRTTGTLNVYTSELHTFSDEEVRTLAAYAELSALALERARLYERVLAIEDELRQSERLSALGLLAAEIAHEIRNPLTVMKMLHHSLNPEFTDPDPRSMDFRLLGEKMDHMNRIVDRVLDFARTAEPKLGPVNLNQLIEDMGLLLRAKLQASGVALVKQLAATLPEILGDATQLEQAFLNLALNAIEAMPAGGRLVIRSRTLPWKTAANRGRAHTPPPTHVLLRFRDTGVGMTADQQDRVFTSLLSSTKAKGSGIGMAIVSRVLDAHQGVIRVKSRPGAGAVFTMILPVGQ